MKVIIDTDPGHDDLVAIVMASELAEVVAITTVSGNAPLAETTANALVAVDLIGAEVPVFSGADRPRARAPHYPVAVHGASGLDGAPRPMTSRTLAGSDAAAAIVELADADTWLVPIGPLTNVAAALELDPGLAQRIAGISLMGGAIAMGNVTAVAEFNIWTDPEAADIVFRSGARLVMCGLDLTTQVRYDETWVDGLGHEFVAALLRRYLSGHRYGRGLGAPLHDPCAVVAVTHPELFEFADHPVVVECAGEHTRGMTVVDRRPGVAGATVSVARTVDAGEVLRLAADAIGRVR